MKKLLKKRYYAMFLALIILSVLPLPGCSSKTEEQTGPGTDKVADSSEMSEAKEVVSDDMSAVTADQIEDGVYDIEVDSSSSMFNITECKLAVQDGKMTAVMTMGGKGYLYVYMGTGEEAVQAPDTDYIPFEEKSTGEHTYTVPVKALDTGIDCAAFSKRKEKWYDRTLVFLADSLPDNALKEGAAQEAEQIELADGEYDVNVTLEGGSGRAGVKSPAKLTVKDGRAYAEIVWSSKNFDYMIVDGEKYLNENEDGNSTFTIPVAGFHYKIPVTADTTAMSTPHEIAYTLNFELAGQDFSKLDWKTDISLVRAKQFQVEESGGYRLISINEGGRFLLVPEGKELPGGIPEDVTVLREPLDKTYLVSTSAMDLVCKTGSLSCIRFSGTRQENWYVDEAKRAMEEEQVVYAGKYNAPDYELLLSGGCDLAIENTMIYHNPEVKEKLEELDIPVLVERSSYEADPLGRLEWIRLYGVLYGKEEEAEAYFNEELRKVQPILNSENTGLTAAFFSVASDGSITVRKSQDYISKMIRMAGGEYVFSELGGEKENALSTVKMQMEDFYAGAKDADVIIYNSAIEAELGSIDELLGKNALFSDFEAVKKGNVFCTGKNFFQQTAGSCDFIRDMNQVFAGISQNTEIEQKKLRFLKKLR